MGIILAYPIFAFLVFGPAFFLLRSKKGTPNRRIVWAAATVIGSFLFAGVVGLALHIIGNSLGLSVVEQKFGRLGDISAVGTLGFFAMPWIIYSVFKTKYKSDFCEPSASDSK